MSYMLLFYPDLRRLSTLKPCGNKKDQGEVDNGISSSLTVFETIHWMLSADFRETWLVLRIVFSVLNSLLYD